MAEQTFKSPGFYPREIDIALPGNSPSGTPAGVIGTAQRGPAFIPITVADRASFIKTFGNLDPNKAGPFALTEFLKSRNACTYMRVLGAGANFTIADFGTTEREGTVRNAGFTIQAAAPPASLINPASPGFNGAVTFINAVHAVSASQEGVGMPMFSQNDSMIQGKVLRNLPGLGSTGKVAAGTAYGVVLTRAMILVATGTRLQLLDGDNNGAGSVPGTKVYPQPNKGVGSARAWTGAAYGDQATPFGSVPRSATQSFYNLEGTRLGFKMVISSSAQNFGTSPGGYTCVRMLTASLDPRNQNYLSKVLNTDPKMFQKEQHLLYAHWPVEHEIAPLCAVSGTIAIASGSDGTTQTGGDKTTSFLQLFGKFDTRYTFPKTTKFISQPYGDKEWDLFHFEALDDGAYANDKFKISIANLKASADSSYQYPNFEVQVRDFSDTDAKPRILESYPACNLDPNSDNYVLKKIGDLRHSVNFDSEYENERNITVKGRYPVKSDYVRIIVSPEKERGEVPETAVPFGFRGIPVIKTNDSLTDVSGTVMQNISGKNIGSLPGFISTRLTLSGAQTAREPLQTIGHKLRYGIVPPLPFRFKCTKGSIGQDPVYVGQAGADERADRKYYWGVQNTMLPITSSISTTGQANAVLRPNEGTELNPIVNNYTKFLGIQKLDTLVTGTGADLFNNNKFTLARVALRTTLNNGDITFVSGTANTLMKNAAYIRNGIPNPSDGTIVDPRGALKGVGNPLTRITLATLFASSSAIFNRLTGFAKFTNIFYGGFDGLNILDKDQSLMNDRATSVTIGGGKAATDYSDNGLASNPAGSGVNNSNIRAYQVASRIMTNKFQSSINILAVPGIREPLVTDQVGNNVRDFGLAIYIMDIPNLDEDGTRLYLDETTQNESDVNQTALDLDLRNIDNNYVATYFPDVYLNDAGGMTVKVPASVPTLGAFGVNDNTRRQWFAPAGFSRGALGSVSNVVVRVSAGDRDELYENRINPIATLPSAGTNNNPGFVIFGQKNLQAASSALDRVNVRRLLLELKRQIIGVARRLLFDQNTAAARANFINQVTPRLAIVQAQQGIEQFKVVMDDSNNSADDRLNNRLNGTIMVVPTRTAEFIAMDFIIDQAGVTFQ